jgi:F0F1-type ATP synthase assembly protein I
MPFATQPRAEEATPRDKRRILIAVAALVVVVAAVSIWAAVRPGAYGSSGNGCVTVNMASSTGGALIHDCGSAAKTLCRHAFTASDKISLLTRPQCRLAGLAP